MKRPPTRAASGERKMLIAMSAHIGRDAIPNAGLPIVKLARAFATIFVPNGAAPTQGWIGLVDIERKWSLCDHEEQLRIARRSLVALREAGFKAELDNDADHADRGQSPSISPDG